ncbi:helix-turn-helix domain-containing protein [Rubrivirga marina]|uniref:Helix-turn-helix domain-containing protein n=1 Tax=Rubrivirga marina TaxID=1196024 RepID=A0A271J409_9BACT|nr:helix-turn-helix domain-containing protein [Rubrivirga marina]PAP78018.1 hypothetical protein BSZ37_17010 [Rubrivirga marina]
MPDLITTTEAARRKGCSRQTIVDAIGRGEIEGSKVGPVWVVSDDTALAAWEVREIGGRLSAGPTGRAAHRASAGT